MREEYGDWMGGEDNAFLLAGLRSRYYRSQMAQKWGSSDSFQIAFLFFFAIFADKSS